ncbi:MAG TPA: hypothetical protein VF158_01960 [Longimicrobiales bacterium]
MSRTPRRRAIACCLLLAAAGAAPAVAQQPAGAETTDRDAGEWNAPRALELIARARERRHRPQVDSTLRNYRAFATGYVYFFLDRHDTDERTLLKVDQVALEVYWGAPNRTKQRIVGLRDQKALPNNIHYHLDHLTVVQNEFDDRIRVGDGDEVRDVLHPAARGSEAVYDFRIADSLSLRLGGAPEPIRVYELEVRPKHPDRPGYVGSIFVDRASADIVRMTFTFTPASYVDPRLDYIRISLDNGLWEGRYWLPYEQRLELRRQIRWLDLAVGGVIRGTMRVGDYRFNLDLPEGFFRGPRVVAAPARQREAYAFEEGLFAGLDEEGLAPMPDLAALRARAAELIGAGRLSGLPRLRPYLPNASSGFRYNRAEGAYLGAGLKYLHGATRAEVVGGYAWGAEHLSVATTVAAALGDATTLRLRGERRGLRDLGWRPGVAGVLNTLSSAFSGEDFLDPYFVDGVGAALEHRLGGAWTVGAGAALERHRSARLVEESAPLDDDAPFRPVAPVDEGTLLAGRAVLRREAPAGRAAGWNARLVLEAGTLDGAYVRPVLEADARVASADRGIELVARAAAGLVAGDAPAQRLFLLGGRGTVPGYPYRTFIGDRFAVADVELSRRLFGPWVRLRAVGAAGWTALHDAAVPAGWSAAPTDGIRASAGVGLSLIYDVLRIDRVRPLDGSGGWTTILSVSPRLLDLL